MTEFAAKYQFEFIRSASRLARSNGQAERSNKTIVQGIQKRAFSRKKWFTDFEDILWACRTTQRESTGQSSFMVYKLDPLNSIEVKIPTLRVVKVDVFKNDQKMLDYSVFLYEWKNKALMRLEECAWKIARHYNKHVIPEESEVEDIVLKRAFKEGKLEPNWEGPYIILVKLRGGAHSITTTS